LFPQNPHQLSKVAGIFMKNKIIIVSCFALIALGFLGAAIHIEKPFAPNVDLETGAIRIPEDYTRWATLGTWAHANTDLKGKPGSIEYHVVYTPPETIDYYREYGRFPDGAVLVKELLHTETMPMTTGSAVSHATTVKGWFVLVRDTKDRFKDSSLWGDGWGWSLFSADDSINTVSTNYRENCLGCHVPAAQFAGPDAEEADKWIYTFGYPALQKRSLGHFR